MLPGSTATGATGRGAQRLQHLLRGQVTPDHVAILVDDGRRAVHAQALAQLEFVLDRIGAAGGLDRRTRHGRVESALAVGGTPYRDGLGVRRGVVAGGGLYAFARPEHVFDGDALLVEFVDVRVQLAAEPAVHVGEDGD